MHMQAVKQHWFSSFYTGTLHFEFTLHYFLLARVYDCVSSLKAWRWWRWWWTLQFYFHQNSYHHKLFLNRGTAAMPCMKANMHSKLLYIRTREYWSLYHDTVKIGLHYLKLSHELIIHRTSSNLSRKSLMAFAGFFYGWNIMFFSKSWAWDRELYFSA